MNEIVWFLLRDKFMPEMHLRQSRIYICLWTIYKKQRIQKFDERGDARIIYQTELDKACF